MFAAAAMPASRCGTAWIAATETALSMNASARPRTARRQAVSAKLVSGCMPSSRNIDSAASASPIVSTTIGAMRPMSRPTNGLTTAVVPLRNNSRTAIASGARCCVPPRKRLSRNIAPTSANSPVSAPNPEALNSGDRKSARFRIGDVDRASTTMKATSAIAPMPRPAMAWTEPHPACPPSMTP